jgi:zinc protease
MKTIRKDVWMSSLFRATVLAAALAAALPAVALDLDAKVPVGPQVKVGKLPNGLAYYIQRNGKPEQRLELRLVVKAGSVLEDDDQQGLAHMIEHLAFNGSTHFKKHELVSYLESIGVKVGADLNAYTRLDETVYMLPVPTSRKENVDMAFTVLEDWAHGMTLHADDVDKERPIVLEEARKNKGAQERLRTALAPKLYNGSRYALREPIGKEDVIRTAPADALRRFYRDWYRPDLMAVIVVGDIDPAEAEKQIKAHFAGLVNPPHERARTYASIAPFTTNDAFVFTDGEVPGSSLMLNYPIRHEPDPGTYRGYRDKIIDNLATMLLNQRLGELTQQAHPPFLGAGANTTPVTATHKLSAVGAGLGPGGPAPAIAAIEQELRRVRQSGFSEAELERGRKIYLSVLENDAKARTTTDSSKFVEEYQRNFLAGEEIPGIEAELGLVREFLPAIGVADVNAAVRKAFPADAPKLIVYADNGKGGPAPTAAQLLAADTAAAQAPVTDRAEKKLPDHLMERPAAPGRIVAETRDDKLGLTRLTLSNGVHVILKPTAFRKDQVLLGARRYGGTTLADEKDFMNARVAPEVAVSMGLKDFAPLDMQKIVAGRKVQLNVGTTEYTDEINGQSASGPEDVETMFQVLWLRFAGVRRDESLYKAYTELLTQVVRNRAGVPEQRFADAVVDAQYGGHPYEARVPRPEDLARVDLDRSLALYRQRFGSAKGMTFVVVGDFDVAAIKPLVTTYLGTLPTPDLPLAYRDVGLRIARGVVKKEVQAGTEPKSLVSLTFSGPAAWSDAEAQRMDVLVDVMNLRVIAALRERLGLIYGAQVKGSVQPVPYPHYEINAVLPTGPEKVDRLVAAMFAEIDSVRKDGPTQAELDKVKANWRATYTQRMSDNGFWLGHLTGAQLTGAPPERILTMMDEVGKLTVADLRATAQRYFDKNNYVQVVLMPEAKVQTATIAK